MRHYLTALFLCFSLSLFGGELHQIEKKSGSVFVLDDGSVWEYNELYDGAVHVNGSVANDPQGLEEGDGVVVYKWYPNATTWQVMDAEGREIRHPEDLYLFHGDGLHYMTLVRAPRNQRVTEIDFKTGQVEVNGETYRVRVFPGEENKLKQLWKLGDPVFIAADSELTGDPRPTPVIVNIKNNAILKTLSP